MTLPLKDLLSWCKETKKKAGVTNVQLSDMTGIPIGTMERIMAGKIEDAKFSTIQPVVSALLGLISDGFSCPATATVNDAEMERLRHRVAELEHTEAENEKLERHLAEMREDHAKELETVRTDTAQRVEYLKSVVKDKEARASRLLWGLLALGLFDILVLSIDFLNPNIGYLRW